MYVLFQDQFVKPSGCQQNCLYLKRVIYPFSSSSRNHHVGRSRRSLAESSNATCINIKSNLVNSNNQIQTSSNLSNNLSFQPVQVSTAVANAANIINNNFEPIGGSTLNSSSVNNNNNNEADLHGEHPPMIGVPSLKVSL